MSAPMPPLPPEQPNRNRPAPVSAEPLMMPEQATPMTDYRPNSLANYASPLEQPALSSTYQPPTPIMREASALTPPPLARRDEDALQPLNLPPVRRSSAPLGAVPPTSPSSSNNYVTPEGSTIIEVGWGVLAGLLLGWAFFSYIGLGQSNFTNAVTLLVAAIIMFYGFVVLIRGIMGNNNNRALLGAFIIVAVLFSILMAVFALIQGHSY